MSILKNIYFIRHGESENNAKSVRQGPLGKLSELGKKQAAFVGERFKQIPIDVILVSPFERTRETANIINEHIHKPLELCDLLTERKNPSEIINKSADDPEVAKIINTIDKSFHDSNLRYSDEENFDDLRERAKKLLYFLQNRPEKNIMCVTHAIFLRLVALYIEYGDNIDSHELVRLSFLNPVHNGSLTLCQWDESEAENEHFGWKLTVWDDYPRLLGEETHNLPGKGPIQI